MKKATLNKVFASALAVALCVPMLVVNPMTVNAVSGNTVSGNTSSSESSASSSSSSSSSSNSGSVTVGSNATVVIAGRNVTTTVGGVFVATAVNGAAITTPYASVASAAGLSQADIDAGTNVRFYICNSTNKAMKDALKSAAEATGKNVAAYINVDLYTITKKGAVTAIRNATAPVTMTFGLPGRIAGSNASIMCVDSTTGKAVVMEDTDTDPRTITVDATVFGVYAIVY